MQMGRNRKSDSGFGLIGVLIATAIGMVAVAGITESIILMVRSQQSIEVTRASEMIADQIEADLSNEAVCSKEFLKGTPAMNMTANSWTDQSAKLPINGAQTMIDATSATPNVTPQLKVIKFAMATMPPPAIQFTAPKLGVPTTYDLYRVKLRFQTQKNTSGLFPPVSAPRDIMMNFVVDPGTGVVQSCVAQNNETRACEVSGGMWNPLGDPGQKCVPFQYCEWGGAYANYPDSEGGFKNALTGGYSCPSTSYVAQQSGVIATAERSGKYGITNTFKQIYSCMRCGAGTAPASAVVTSQDSGLTSALTDLDTSQTTNYNNGVQLRNAICGTVTAAQCAAIPMPAQF